MGWKNIKKEFCPDMDVYLDGETVRIYFNGYEIIRINTENLDIIVNNTLKTSKIVTSLSWKLENAKKNGSLKKQLNDPDLFERDLPVFTIKENKVVQEFCEEYGHDNPTHSGKKMGNTYFQSRKEAIKYLRKTTTQNLKDTFRYSFVDSFKKAFRGTWKLLKSVFMWIKIRIL